MLGSAGPAVAQGPPPRERFSVLVVGGTPAGVAAAVAAARAGVRTVLIEPGAELGGQLVSAWLNTFDMNRGPYGQHLTRGIFLEVYRQLGQSFDPERARNVFHRLALTQPNLTVLRRTSVEAPIVAEGTLAGVTIIDAKGRRGTVLADVLIDATDDADLAAAAGVPFTIGREDTGKDRRMQAATLIFRLGGVDAAAVSAYLSTHEKPQGIGGAASRTAWGYSRIASRYRPDHPRLALYDLNLGWLSDGTVLVNGLQIYGVDGLDPASVRAGRALALAELPRIVVFLRAHAPGFERARLRGAAPALYIRETRHVVGLYRIEIKDILNGRDFHDRVAVASYPIDIHPIAPKQINLIAARRTPYAIPFRAIVSRNVANLMVVGRSMSATHAAAGSLRVVPTGMALGEAAGVAAALAVRSGRSPAQMASDPIMVLRLQRALVAGGAFVATPQSVHATEVSRRRSP